jgi:hypothetical protein
VVLRHGYGHDVVMDFAPGEDLVRASSDGIETWDDLRARIGEVWDGTALLRLDDGTPPAVRGVASG